jgi:hypothetical protein
MTPELAETLGRISEAASHAIDPWWIIGSAAVVLHGGNVPHVKDVDLLMSARDADALLRRIGEVPRGGTGNGRFRSEVFGTWSKPPIPVEAFGGFEVAVAGSWRRVSLATREAVTVGTARVFVPARDELVRLLESFGRPKDVERAALLRGM